MILVVTLPPTLADAFVVPKLAPQIDSYNKNEGAIYRGTLRIANRTNL